MASPGSAKTLTLAAICICLAGSWWRKKTAKAASEAAIRSVVGTTFIGAALLMLAGTMPEVVIPAAGLLIVDALVLSPSGVSMTAGLTRVVTGKPGVVAISGRTTTPSIPIGTGAYETSDELPAPAIAPAYLSTSLD